MSIESYSAALATPTDIPVFTFCHAEELLPGAPFQVCVERSTALICSSVYGEKLIHALVPSAANKTVVIPPSLNLRDYSSVPRTKRNPMILSIARLDSRKNIATLISAFGLFTKQHPTATLGIVGDGPEREALELLAAQKAPGRVRFFGWITEARKRQLLARAQVFALCPRFRDDRAEGFGIVFLEAQAAGTPIVGSKVGGVPESAGPHSLLVRDPLDEKSIAAALTRVWTDSAVWNSQHKAGLLYVKQFNQKSYLDNILKTISQKTR